MNWRVDRATDTCEEAIEAIDVAVHLVTRAMGYVVLAADATGEMAGEIQGAARALEDAVTHLQRAQAAHPEEAE